MIYLFADVFQDAQDFASDNDIESGQWEYVNHPLFFEGKKLKKFDQMLFIGTNVTRMQKDYRETRAVFSKMKNKRWPDRNR